ncbi:bifunctional biotin--[acetyl-CoA-carboxylase] ligase/biotin operon repressor BirA [Enterovibrio nigricans]|uniref:Bifunctional ligase/repressor BirA n=1 Tax=Enterovibrio nigricans DSM 22720 TaxID=1121868 RepID=A0A1T4VYD2_9GAMM|nr:bifunctional biotin--[acetyl-CoA-carboxylase] ligase/biotin operon repressor BirA [Enterovibrio nigricans]PKF49142.1 bifunctional biotin--[acetyl-CoA-carboxylase] ligase/biotin operon repressor BirA [Enterovibrio nigricans]SKA69909.1 BirA family transcriptional regulator, biotin operon repressor / biotin-[acetyl-CoA-carboxylase] ligase [Enterovibrio nigricans DSM 22720]
MPALDNTARLSLIRKLADGQFHSGEKLGQELGMSRAAISKHIKVLQQWGVDVYRVQGKGYCLPAPLNLLNDVSLNEKLNVPAFSLIPVIDSTNQYLLDRVGQLESGTACLAEYQQSGRGRRGRAWFSPFGANLYLSMYWRLDAGMAAAMGLSLVVGVSMAETLNQLGAKNVRVKWPNDLYWNDRKLAGILVEMTGQAGDAAHLVIGMGLNVSMPETDAVDQVWANLKDACNPLPDKNDLAAALINGVTEALLQYEDVGMAGFVAKWDKYDNFNGRAVKLLMGERVVKGVARGINEQGALMLETELGITPYLGGEISLRADD